METLPQNIQLVGEKGSEHKIIYIHQKVYHSIHRFSQGKTKFESGGILLGRVTREFGKEHLIIEGFVEAKYSKATPTTLTFTHETWDYVYQVIEKKHKGRKIIGWIHTHPDFGIFLSENDRFIHNNFFTDQSQVAYVVDPVRQEEGFYLWVKDQLERSTGFYVFDEIGKKIRLEDKQEDPEVMETSVEGNAISKLYMAAAILSLLLAIVAMLMTYQTHMRLKALESTFEVQQSQYFYYLQNLQDQINQSAQPEVVEPAATVTDGGIVAE